MTFRTLQSRSIGIITIAPFISLGIGSFAWANPLPGEVLKFQQLPLGDLVTNPKSQFPGHDETSTATLSTAAPGYSGIFAADDFSDNSNNPVVDVQWWGSYIPTGALNTPIQQFLISFETNVPQNSASGFSQPGQVINSEVVNRVGTLVAGAGDFTEQPEPALSGPDGPLYEYNAELSVPFNESAGTTYWLKIVALTGQGDPTQWGWHNRDYTIPDPYAAAPGDLNLGTNDTGQPVFHYLDDAVTGDIAYNPIPPPPLSGLVETNMSPLLYSTNPAVDGFGVTGVVPPSEDLAFDLYYASVPEPVGLPLLAAGMFLLRRHRRST